MRSRSVNEVYLVSLLQKKEKPAPKKKEEKTDGKKQTKLGIETLKEDNYSEWYSQVGQVICWCLMSDVMSYRYRSNLAVSIV